MTTSSCASMIDATKAIQAMFVLETVGILAFYAFPGLTESISYGARTTSQSSQKKSAQVPATRRGRTTVDFFLAMINNTILYPVPHWYFEHFYIVSVLSSLFWGFQIFTRGTALKILSGNHTADGPAMSIEQVVLVWFLMAVQGSRRLYESATLVKRSSSKMPFVAYMIGIVYYLAMGIAVWIHGSRTILSTELIQDFFTFSAPSIRTIVFLPIFILASGVQNDCHRYLASLPKYSLPLQPVFQHIVCPHYTAECLIYLSLSFLAAPQGIIVNPTIFTVFVFCVVNLGGTADTTKKWSAEKFGTDKVSGRWRMIPYIW